METKSSPTQESHDSFNKTFDFYKLIIEEYRHLHHVWIDNFRNIITFNSIILAGSFAILALLSGDKNPYFSDLAIKWSLRAIPFIGIIVTLVGLQLIRRIKAITSLRISELRYIENDLLKEKIPVLPFEEGAFVLGLSKKEIFLKNKSDLPYLVTPLKRNILDGLGGYFFIGGAFIFAYIVIIVISFF
jgi:hypothetical protein